MESRGRDQLVVVSADPLYRPMGRWHKELGLLHPSFLLVFLLLNHLHFLKCPAMYVRCLLRWADYKLSSLALRIPVSSLTPGFSLGMAHGRKGHQLCGAGWDLATLTNLETNPESQFPYLEDGTNSYCIFLIDNGC